MKDVALSYWTPGVEIFNVTNSADRWKSMADAASLAAARMKQAGETDFTVNIQGGPAASGSHESLAQVALREHRRFLAIASDCSRKNKPVALLSEEESFAICVACGIPLETERGSKLVLKSRTKYPVGIVLEPGIAGTPGNYTVYVKK